MKFMLKEKKKIIYLHRTAFKRRDTLPPDLPSFVLNIHNYGEWTNGFLYGPFNIIYFSDYRATFVARLYRGQTLNRQLGIYSKNASLLLLAHVFPMYVQPPDVRGWWEADE